MVENISTVPMCKKKKLLLDRSSYVDINDICMSIL